MNIGIIGVGGVGGYFGGKICRLVSPPDINVFFVARGRHLEEIRNNGLCVSTTSEGEWVCRPALATDRIDDLPVLDICLLCVKSYDLKQIVSQLCNRVTGSTLIVPLLNGIDIYDRVRGIIGTARVLPACAYVGTHLEYYGKVTQQGGACTILLGDHPSTDEKAPVELFRLFERSAVKYTWFENVYPEIWGKYIFISAFGLVTAAFDKTLGQIMESESLSSYVLAVMNEIVRLSVKMGITLPENIITDSYRKGSNFPHQTKTSFQRDIELLDKPDERDLFGGTIMRLGLKTEVETPVTEELSRMIDCKKAALETNRVTVL